MFAPPPVQLSRAEVAARLEAKRRNVESAGSLTNSLHRHDSRSPSSSDRHHVFSNKAGKVKVSSSIPTSPPASPKRRKKSSSIFKFVAGEEVEDSPDLPNGFGEHPRQAPEPPRRGTRPPSDFFERRGPGKSFPPQTLVPQIPQPPLSPPPIPARSPRRILRQLRDNAESLRTQSASHMSPVTDALSYLTLDDTSTNERPPQPRSLSAPVVSIPENTTLMARSRQMSDVGGADSTCKRPRTDSVSIRDPSIGIEDMEIKGQSTSRRPSGTGSVRGMLQQRDKPNLSDSQELIARRSSEDDSNTESHSIGSESDRPWKHRRKAEGIMKPLSTASYTPAALKRNIDEATGGICLPVPFKAMNKDLPATPTSINASPTGLYHVISPRPTRSAIQNPRHKNKKSPLSPISTTHAKANSAGRGKEDDSPSRLSAIPELTKLSEKSPISSGLSTPIETQIHLRNGSVVTVSPPEMTAWKQTYYIQGPIKLPKPVIVPRKNSMASLEAFQEVVDQIYQEALNIPRRRSDDAVVDDVCEFVDDFGFDEINFEGDLLAADETMIDEVKGDSDQDSGCFSNTPSDEEPSPVEKVLAQEIIHTLARPSQVPKPPIPPVENEETLRAKGIARLAHGMASHNQATMQHDRNDTETMSKAEPTVLPLFPLPEESMLEAVLEPSWAENDVPMVDLKGDSSGFDWDDDVEELDSQTHWLHPGLFPRRRRASRGHHRRVPSTTPIQRMMELAFL
jgi:hypothetical protein